MFDVNYNINLNVTGIPKTRKNKKKDMYAILKACRKYAKPDYYAYRKEARATVPGRKRDQFHPQEWHYVRSDKTSLKHHVDGKDYINPTKAILIFNIYAHTRHFHLLRDGHYFYGHYPWHYYYGFVAKQPWTHEFIQVATQFQSKITGRSYFDGALTNYIKYGNYGVGEKVSQSTEFDYGLSSGKTTIKTSSAGNQFDQTLTITSDDLGFYSGGQYPLLQQKAAQFEQLLAEQLEAWEAQI